MTRMGKDSSRAETQTARGPGIWRRRDWRPLSRVGTRRRRVEIVVVRRRQHPAAFFTRKAMATSRATWRPRTGMTYAFRLDGEDAGLSRSRIALFSPRASMALRDRRSRRFRWHDAAWRGVAPDKASVIYEMHVGTFTPEGTCGRPPAELPELAALRHHRARGDAAWPSFPGGLAGATTASIFSRRRGFTVARRFPAGSSMRAHAVGLGVIL